MSCCHIEKLSTVGNSSIGACGKCETVYFYHNNLLLHFSYEQFENFAESIVKIKFEDGMVCLPGNVSGIVLRTMHRDIRMVFSREEFFDLCEAISVAHLQLRALLLVNEDN